MTPQPPSHRHVRAARVCAETIERLTMLMKDPAWEDVMQMNIEIVLCLESIFKMIEDAPASHYLILTDPRRSAKVRFDPVGQTKL